MQYQDYLEMVPGKRSGKPCIINTRITVYDVLEWLAIPMTPEEISEDYPEIKTEQILACLAFAASRETTYIPLRHEVITRSKYISPSCYHTVRNLPGYYACCLPQYGRCTR